MIHQPDQTHHFLRAAHRRWMLWRIFEHGGIGLTIGCAAAMPLVLILWWRSQSALPLASAAIALGAFFGLVVGILRRPTLLQTAVHADRQFNLNDLLTTALTVRTEAHVDESWLVCVVSLADARSSVLRPSDLILRQLGARAWGGIGLSLALVMTLGLMSVVSRDTIAHADSTRTPVGGQSSGQSPLQSNSVKNPRLKRDPNLMRSSEARDYARSSDPSASRVLDQTQPRQPETDTTSDFTSDDGLGTAAAASQTHSPQSDAPRIFARGESESEGDVPAGGGVASAPDASSGDDVTAKSQAEPVRDHAAPWTSPGWAADREKATQSASQRRLPDAYRDLVREYFQTGSKQHK